VLGVDASLLADLAKVDIAADGTLVADSDNWERHTTVADNTFMDGTLLLYFGKLHQGHVHLLNFLLEELCDGLLDQCQVRLLHLVFTVIV